MKVLRSPHPRTWLAGIGVFALLTSVTNAGVTVEADPVERFHVVDLGTDEPAGVRARKATNANGDEVGWSYEPRPRGVWQNATLRRGGGAAVPLRPDHNGLASAAYAINRHGDVVGWAEFAPASPDDREHAFLASGRLRDLGTLTGRTGRSVAFDVNDARQVVGTSEVAGGGTRAFLWENDVMQDLGTLPGDSDSEAYAINARGDIAGKSYQKRCGPCVPRAVRWSNGVATDLNTLIAPDSGWTLLEALEITDDGAVIGRGRVNGETRYFLLEP
jgi:probable HAF family extracellular repeat protein